MTECNWLRPLGVMISLLALASAGGCQLSVGESEDEDGGESSEDPDPGESAPTGGTNSAPTGGTSGTAAGGTNSTPAGGTNSTSNSAPLVEVCGAEEAIDNNDRDHAQPLGASATFCVKGSDHDWFYVDAPDDGKAHVLQLDFDEDPEAWIQARVYADADFSDLGGFIIDEGTKSSVWITVGPGTRTLFDFRQYVSSDGGLSRVKATLTAEKDQYEPNNERDAAVAITQGSPVRAQLIVPYVADNQRTPDDWYKVELAAGAHVFKLTEVPQDVYLKVAISDSNRVAVASDTPPNEGATFDFPFEVKADGTYYFQLSIYIGGLPVIIEGNPPGFVTDEYAFTVE
jgi:hypothetical protein